MIGLWPSRPLVLNLQVRGDAAFAVSISWFDSVPCNSWPLRAKVHNACFSGAPILRPCFRNI